MTDRNEAACISRRGMKRIYLDEVADLLRAGMSFEQVCQSLEVEEGSVVNAVHRSGQRGIVNADTTLIRKIRRTQSVERWAAAYARRHRGMYL